MLYIYYRVVGNGITLSHRGMEDRFHVSSLVPESEQDGTREGIEREGIEREREGIEREGIEREREGIEREGIEREGIEREGIEREGIEIERKLGV